MMDNLPYSKARAAAVHSDDIIMPMSQSHHKHFDENVQGFQAYNLPQGMAVVLIPKEDIEDLQEHFRTSARRRSETVEKLQESTLKGRRENRTAAETIDVISSTFASATSGGAANAGEFIRKVQEKASALPKQLADVKRTLEQHRVQIDALEFELLKFDNDLNLSERRHQLAEVRANELEAKLRPMTPRPARDYLGMREELPPDDFDVLESAVERYGDLSPRFICNILVGRSFGPLGRSLTQFQPQWGKLKRSKCSVTSEDAITALSSYDPIRAVTDMEDQLPPDVFNFLLYCATGDIDVRTAGYLLNGTVEGVDVKPSDWGALDGKLDPKDLEKIITCARRGTQQRLRDAEAHAVDLTAELEKAKMIASEMAPLEERKRRVMQRRNVNKNARHRKKESTQADAVETFLERAWQDTFIGLGMSAEIPRILRFTGKVRNKGFTKLECEQKVKEIWAAKLAEEKRNGGISLQMDEFVYDFIKERTPGPVSGVIETGYNFVHSLKRFDYDADCDLFLMVFLGEISEEVYKDQLRLVFDINKLFFIMEALHGENGRLPKKVIRAGLRAFFSHEGSKSEDRITEIIKAVDEDCPGTHAEWHKLFEEDQSTFNQSHFVERIRFQMLEERLEYFQHLEDVLYTLTGWHEACTKVQIQNAVMQLDITGKMKAEEAQWLVQKGIQGGGLKSGELTVTKVMSKLRQGGVLTGKKRTDHDDPLKTGKKPGDGIPKPEPKDDQSAADKWKTALKGAKKAMAPKVPSQFTVSKIIKELKNLTPPFTAAVAAIKEMAS